MAARVTPAIILVRPQLGENIGKVARAMGNFGLEDLRLVKPRDGWPNPDAVPAAAGADWLLEKAQVFETLEAAIADCHDVYATTARRRDMIKPVQTPREIAVHMGGAGKVGILFGAEAAGLTNDEVALASTIISFPCNPAFSSFNLAQAVFLVAYEWFLAGAGEQQPFSLYESAVADRGELIGLLEQLEEELDRSGFLRPAEKRPQMVRNIRNIFTRMALTSQEVRTLRGIVKSLAVYGRSRSKPGKV
ncbi:MAG: RNA methyltransferase [Alphaproteobacteria bacterium]|nr:MAG: RNA methyltransferase [Alphaproteobacteria bacterium]